MNKLEQEEKICEIQKANFFPVTKDQILEFMSIYPYSFDDIKKSILKGDFFFRDGKLNFPSHKIKMNVVVKKDQDVNKCQKVSIVTPNDNMSNLINTISKKLKS